jgi:hypothetical protein
MNSFTPEVAKKENKICVSMAVTPGTKEVIVTVLDTCVLGHCE